jgi:HK97 family phage prohead protease
MYKELERRFIPCDPGILEEVRAEGEEASYKIKGTPIVYNRECVIYEGDGYRWLEIIEPGAAREALTRAEQVLLWNHDSAKPMAARKNNTLTAREDGKGVHIEADVSGTVWGREGHEAIRAGLVNKMSFGFYVKPEGCVEERYVENGKRVFKRTIKKFDRIVDFSPVTYPAYQDTEVSARDAESLISEFEAEDKKRNETKEGIQNLLNEFPEEKIDA